MQYVQELLFCNKLEGSTAQWTFNSYKKVNPTSLYHEKNNNLFDHRNCGIKLTLHLSRFGFNSQSVALFIRTK